MENTLKLGFLGVGGKFVIEGDYIKFLHPYAWKNFRIRIDQVDTVSVSNGTLFGGSVLKIVGKGTTLAEAKMPANWANKAQDWILDHIKG